MSLQRVVGSRRGKNKSSGGGRGRVGVGAAYARRLMN